RIYAGQLAVLDKGPAADAIRRMAETELRHLRDFDRMMVERRVRPTALSPLWHVAGYALGAATALMGPKAAMACTEAVEDVIVGHYARQETVLGADDPQLRGLIEGAREDEAEHARTALASGARDTPCHEPLTAAIRAGTRLAIWLSERV
ncbi:MAG: demethoxyubiquinone hydroxylase family protein, partial [Alphaproteobacteria bacterium]